MSRCENRRRGKTLPPPFLLRPRKGKKREKREVVGLFFILIFQEKGEGGLLVWCVCLRVCSFFSLFVVRAHIPFFSFLLRGREGSGGCRGREDVGYAERKDERKHEKNKHKIS